MVGLRGALLVLSLCVWPTQQVLPPVLERAQQTHQKGSRSSAEDSVRKAITHESVKKVPRALATAHDLYGRILLESSSFDQAVRQFQQAIRADGSFGSAYVNLGHVQRILGHFDASVEVLHTGLGLGSMEDLERGRAWKELAKTYTQSNALAKAKTAYTESYTLTPTDPSLLAPYVTTLVWLGDTAQAQGVMLKAVRAGVYGDPLQYPEVYFPDVRSAPFPDPSGYPDVMAAIEIFEDRVPEIALDFKRVKAKGGLSPHQV